jgi:hypothetical protein
VNAIEVGTRESGKSTLALWLGLEHSRATFCWDPRNMFDGELVRTGEELQDVIDARPWEDVERYPKGYVTHFVPFLQNPETGIRNAEFEEFLAVLFPPDFRYRSFSCILDEANKFQTYQTMNPYLDRVLRQAPRNILVVQTTHSLQDYNRASKDLMDDLYIFRLKGRSLDAMVEYVDGSEELRETVATLPHYHLVHYQFGWHEGAEFEVWGDPGVWYVPLSQNGQAVQDASGRGRDAAFVSDGGSASAHPATRSRNEDEKPSSENSFQGWVN